MSYSTNNPLPFSQLPKRTDVGSYLFNTKSFWVYQNNIRCKCNTWYKHNNSIKSHLSSIGNESCAASYNNEEDVPTIIAQHRSDTGASSTASLPNNNKKRKTEQEETLLLSSQPSSPRKEPQTEEDCQKEQDEVDWKAFTQTLYACSLPAAHIGDPSNMRGRRVFQEVDLNLICVGFYSFQYKLGYLCVFPYAPCFQLRGGRVLFIARGTHWGPAKYEGVTRVAGSWVFVCFSVW